MQDVDGVVALRDIDHAKRSGFVMNADFGVRQSASASSRSAPAPAAPYAIELQPPCALRRGKPEAGRARRPGTRSASVRAQPYAAYISFDIESQRLKIGESWRPFLTMAPLYVSWHASPNVAGFARRRHHAQLRRLSARGEPASWGCRMPTSARGAGPSDNLERDPQAAFRAVVEHHGGLSGTGGKASARTRSRSTARFSPPFRTAACC